MKASAAIVFAACAAALAEPGPGFDASLALAEEFLSTGDNAAAALEYRRLAFDPAADGFSGELHLLSAAAYLRGGDFERMSVLLDKAEDEGYGPDASPAASYLKLRLAENRGEWVSAMLYAEDIQRAAEKSGNATLAARAAGLRAADAVTAGRFDEARSAASGDPEKLRVVKAYAAGRDKSPAVGGLLGLVPGLGYAYSGEWGNMARSMVLNGLFGWALFECADREEWGLFAVSAFFELTWYTGSIYGGIDAAHRYNRDRLENAVRPLRGSEPEIRRNPAVPALSLGFRF